jgi:uncharacterized protein (DUF885 family)
MTETTSAIHARAYLAKAQEYLASAEANLAASRHTAAAGDAIHAGICAKDAIVMKLTGQVRKAKDHSGAAAELKSALGQRDVTASAERAIRELVGAKSAIEYGVETTTAARALQLVRRARTLVNVAQTV